MNYNASTGSYVAVSSIDLLEECLETIHRARKMSLNARSERAQALLDRRRSKLASQQSRINTNRTSFEKFDVKSYEKDMHSVTGSSSSSSIGGRVGEGTSKALYVNDEAEAPSPAQPQEELSNNQKAELLYAEFEKELSQWWQKAGDKRNDEEARGEYADYLTDKYMCQKLDAFPPSKEITAIRKKMYKTIEDFATDPKFDIKVAEDHQEGNDHKRVTSAQKKLQQVDKNPPRGTGTGQGQGQGNLETAGPSRNKEVSAARTAASTTSKSSKSLTPVERALEQANVQAAARALAQQAAAGNAADALEAPQLTAKEEKALAEKNRIQDQYQQYMKMKQMSVEADRESQMKQYETLNDDIKGLLTSIQTNKSIN
jgi:type II secretory pathway component PulJ